MLGGGSWGGRTLWWGSLGGQCPKGWRVPLLWSWEGHQGGASPPSSPPPPGCLCGAVEAPSQDRVPGVGGGPTGPRLLGVVAVGRAVGRSL